MARVLPNGRLDRTFSRDGRVRRRAATTADEDDAYGATGIAVSRDSRVTVSAVLETDTPSQKSPAHNQTKFALLRFRRNGRADLSFAPGGIRVISFGSDSAFAWDVTLDADGRAIAVGWTLMSAGNLDIAIARVR